MILSTLLFLVPRFPPRVRLSLAVLLEEGREVPDDLLELLVHSGASVPIGDVLRVVSRLGDTEHHEVGQENYEGGTQDLYR